MTEPEIMSRRDVAHEIELMQRVIRYIRPLGQNIELLWCDSPACCVYTAKLRPASRHQSIAELVGRALDQAFIALGGGHNGIFVDDLFFDPWWPEC